MITSRKQRSCDEVAAEVREATGGNVIPVACHVGEWDEVPAFVERVVETYGRIDVLVNNAGINPTLQSVSTVQLGATAEAAA